MKDSEPLIPNDVRVLYEELIEEGGRIVPSDEAFWTQARVLRLLKSGFAKRDPYDPPKLSPVDPKVAQARLALLWRDAMDGLRKAHNAAQADAIRLQMQTVRAAAWRDDTNSCTLVSGQTIVGTLHNAMALNGDAMVREFWTGPYGADQARRYVSHESYVAPAPDLMARGGRQLILADYEVVREYPEIVTRGHADGEEIRVRLKKLPMKLLIADDHAALVALGPYGNPCLWIRDPRLVGVFATLFEGLWAQAEPWAPDGTASAPESDVTRQRVLAALAAGQKDEAIARHLGISARTVRRHVAQLMRDLGASTRFAAGVAAVRQGLIGEM